MESIKKGNFSFHYIFCFLNPIIPYTEITNQDVEQVVISYLI